MPLMAKPANPAPFGDGLEATNRHRLGFRRTVNIDKLRKHVLIPCLSMMRCGFLLAALLVTLAKGKTVRVALTAFLFLKES